MKKADQEPRPRVIIKRQHGGGHHGGAWKVAYSDFVTTMMALFIVLWIVSQNVATREGVAQYFRDPGAFQQGSRPSIAQGGAGVLPGQPPRDLGGAGESEKARDEQALKEAAEDFKEKMEQLGLSETLRDQIKVEITPEGLRIQLLERDGVPFFHVGRAAILPEVRPILENLARAVAPLANNITIEGHTDSRQYANRENYSNWELSTNRTNSARKVMEGVGLAPGRVDRLVGHADRDLLVPSDPLDARNRRITIIVRRQGQS
jgi:chemotaxis protein MotB